MGHSHPPRWQQREKKRAAQREKMLETRNYYDIRDLTPHNAMGVMLNRDFAIKFK